MQFLRRVASSLASPPSLLLPLRSLSTTPAQHMYMKKKFDYGYGTEGVMLYPLPDGKRTSVKAAHDRFKRLDWGMYIRPIAGRMKKTWKKSTLQRWFEEQHVFCARFHVARLERQFDSRVKAKRYIPDDIYEKYNRLSFQKHYGAKHRNNELIRQLGSPIYKFTKWKAHLSKHYSRYNTVETVRYEPPGFFETVASTGGAFTPEFIPQNTPAPHFRRNPVRVGRHMKDKWTNSVKDLETYAGRLPAWDPLLRGLYGYM